MSPTFEASGVRDESIPSSPEPESLHASVVDDEETDDLEAIAIIGFALKFPDDATSPEGFWKMISERRCASREFPKERLNTDAFYHPDTMKRNTVPLRGGHFIEEDLGAFDANFFSITPAEAVGMDPAQRILLETSYHAFENAGIPLESASGSATSVHTGCFTRDHEVTLLRDPEDLPKNSATGSSLSLLANRLSWFFNLTGPSVNLDSACSSSAMALDDACNLLRGRDCDMSLVAGTNLCFAIDYTSFLSKMSFLSPESRCHTFDHRANGYARGEGVGVVLLKRVADAIRDGDVIRAVVRSSKANQDSRTPGITQPSLQAQERLIRETYRKAGLSMKHTRYMEAHGTGTKIGDATETSAIGNAFRLSRSPEDPLYVGSVKTNVGHLEGASGIAGLIKAIMIVETGVILPNTNFEKLNPKIDVEYLRMRLPLSCVPWPTDGLRRASINSFGFGGSNCHVVIDDAHHYLQARGLVAKHRTAPTPPRLVESPLSLLRLQLLNEPENDEGLDVSEHTLKLLILSAHDEDGIARLAEGYQKHIAKLLEMPNFDEETYLGNLIYTLDSCRSSLPFQAHMSINHLSDILEMSKQISNPILARSETPRPAFVFTGQGAQYYDMGRALFAFPVFRDSVHAADQYLTLLSGSTWSATEELHRPESESRVSRADYSQALCTVLQVALVDLLESVGITPFATVGHSSGEIAAAYSAGFISREAAWKIAYSRGQVAVALANKAPVRGAMMAVGLSAEASEPYIAQVNASNTQFPVSVSCVNSQKSTTISGPDAALDELKKLLDAEKVFARKLKVPVGYHSQQMEEVADEYLQLLGKIASRHDATCTVPMISSVVEKRVTAADVQDPAYWVRNLTSPVRFLGAVKKLCSSSRKVLTKKLDGSHENAIFTDMLVEIGPHAALQGPIRDIVKSTARASEIDYAAALRRGNDAAQTFLHLVGNLHELGVDVDLRRLNDPDEQIRKQRTRLSNLPQYSFDHSTSYWHESRINLQYRLRKHRYIELLGTPVLDWNPLDAQWRNVINLAELPWADEHKINGATLCPGAGMMVMAIEGIKQLADPSRAIAAFKLRQVSFRNALDLAGGKMETRLSVRAPHSTHHDAAPWYEFALYSMKSANWVDHCSGSIQIQYEDPAIEEPSGCLSLCKATLEARSKTCDFHADPQQFYQFLDDRGVTYGPSFQALRNLRCSEDHQIVADLDLYQEERTPSSMNVIHPSTLDAFMHSIFVAQSNGGSTQIRTQVPTSVESLWISNTNLLDYPEDSVQMSTEITGMTPRSTKCSAFAVDNSRQSVKILIEGLEMSAVSDIPKSTEIRSEDEMIWNHVKRTVDPDMLTNVGITEWLNESNPSLEQRIRTYIRAISSKHPDLKIAQFGTEDSICTNLTLESMSIEEENSVCAMLFDRYDIIDANADTIEKCQEAFSKYSQKITFGVYDVARSESKPEYKEGSYDILIMTTDDMGTKLASVKRLGKPGSRLFLYSSASLTSKDLETISDSLKSTGFNEYDFVLSGGVNEGSFIVTSLKGDTSTQASLLPPIVAVCDSSSEIQSRTAHALQNLLVSRQACEVSVVSTTDAFQESVRQDCIHVLFFDLDKPFLPKLEESTFIPFQNFLKQTKRVLWVSGGGGAGKADPGFGVTEGFARSLRLEMNELRLVLLSLESFTRSPDEMVRRITQVLETAYSVGQETYEREYTEIEGRLFINRLMPADHLHADNLGRLRGVKHSIQKLHDVPRFAVDFGVPGKIDTVEFSSMETEVQALKGSEVEIEVKAVGLNASDLEVATGMRHGTGMGNECAGVVTRVGPSVDRSIRVGDRACALGSHLYGSHAVIPATTAVAGIPDNVSFEDAATLPRDLWCGAYLAEDIARLRPGDAVLVYSGAGRLALSVAQAAQQLGAVVFVVSHSDGDYQLFKDRLLLADSQILQSTAMASQLRYGKRPGGVDTAFFFSSDEASLQDVMQCVRSPGQFIRWQSGHSSTSAPSTGAGISYNVIDEAALTASFSSSRRSLQTLVDRTLSKTLPTSQVKSFKMSQTEQALRAAKDADSLERSVLHIDPDDAVMMKTDGRSKYTFDPEASYVVSGGFGGLGRFLVRWIVSKGARNVIILSRSGPRAEAAQMLVEELTSQGVRVHAPPCDTSKLETLQTTMDECKSCMPPIKGCIQSAGMIQDVWFDRMEFKDWSALMVPKIDGSWNLHQVLPDEMDFFIFTASISGVMGQITQTNYSSANTYQDALAAYIRRHKPNQRAISLDLGLLMTEGLLKDRPDLVARLRSTGSFLQITEPEIAAIFDRYCDPNLPVSVDAPDLQPVVGIESPARVRAAGRELIATMQQPLWSVMRGISDTSDPDANDGQAEASKSTKPVVEMMASAESPLEAANIAADALARRVAGILGVSPEKFDPQKPGRTYGLDSLAAVDVRNWISKTFSVDVPVFDILGDSSPYELGHGIARKVATQTKEKA